MVFLSHWYAGANSSRFLPSQWAYGLDWMNLGKYGVELFFMISGFVILKSLATRRSTISFFINRFARIYPVFLVLHLMIFISGPLISYKLFHDVDVLGFCVLFMSNLLMLPGVFDFPAAQIVAWSLSYEVLFYILAAWMYQLVCRQGSIPIFKWAVLLVVSAAFVWIHPRSLYFLPGVIAYFALRDEQRSWRISSSVGGLAFIAFLFFWSGLRPEDGESLGQLLRKVGWYPLAALICAGVFFFFVLRGRGPLHALLESRWLVALGEVSYSFYLLHVVVMFPLKRLITHFIQPQTGEEIAFLVFGLATLGITYGLSLVSRKWLEVSVGNWFKENLHGIRAAARERCADRS
jgi:peptidoglycan/LPS O-acetylase OafA/YrhL